VIHLTQAYQEFATAWPEIPNLMKSSSTRFEVVSKMRAKLPILKHRNYHTFMQWSKKACGSSLRHQWALHVWLQRVGLWSVTCMFQITYNACPYPVLLSKIRALTTQKTYISAPAWALTHSEVNFKDAFSFKPERWIGPSTGDLREQSQPFLLGPRACMGRKWVLLHNLVK